MVEIKTNRKSLRYQLFPFELEEGIAFAHGDFFSIGEGLLVFKNNRILFITERYLKMHFDDASNIEIKIPENSEEIDNFNLMLNYIIQRFSTTSNIFVKIIDYDTKMEKYIFEEKELTFREAVGPFINLTKKIRRSQAIVLELESN